MNALLDDSKIHTLPTGERIAINDNVRVLFEVDSLKHATEATVSRCGACDLSLRSLPHIPQEWFTSLQT